MCLSIRWAASRNNGGNTASSILMTIRVLMGSECVLTHGVVSIDGLAAPTHDTGHKGPYALCPDHEARRPARSSRVSGLQRCSIQIDLTLAQGAGGVTLAGYYCNG